VINVVRLAGVAIGEVVDSNTRIERLLLAHFPDEIDRVWSRAGTAEIATDPMGSKLDGHLPDVEAAREWAQARTQEDLEARIDDLLRDFPGVNLIYTQPIEMRMNEMICRHSSRPRHQSVRR